MNTPEPGTTSRRSLVRAGAWSVPVIAVAATAPAASASTTCTMGIDAIVGFKSAHNEYVVVDVLPVLTAGTCGVADYDKPVSVTVTLDSTAYTGKWDDNGYSDWSPTSGSAGTYVYTLTSDFIFSTARDEPRHYVYLYADRVSGAALGPVKFMFFGDGLTSSTITVTPDAG